MSTHPHVHTLTHIHTHTRVHTFTCAHTHTHKLLPLTTEASKRLTSKPSWAITHVKKKHLKNPWTNCTSKAETKKRTKPVPPSHQRSCEQGATLWFSSACGCWWWCPLSWCLLGTPACTSAGQSAPPARRIGNKEKCWPFGNPATDLSNLTTGVSCHKYNFCGNKHVFVMTKHSFCRDKRYACHDKTYFCHDKRQRNFVTTSLLLLRQAHVCQDKTRLWLRQKYACRDKHVFFATNICRHKSFVATNKSFVATNKSFVAASILLSQQKMCLSWQTCVCRDKTFVTSKMVLVAAPAKDSI